MKIELTILQTGNINYENFYVLLPYKATAMKLRFLFFLALMTVVTFIPSVIHADPIDIMATRETKNVLSSLHNISARGIMSGHTDAQAYGVNWKKEKRMFRGKLVGKCIA